MAFAAFDTQNQLEAYLKFLNAENLQLREQKDALDQKQAPRRAVGDQELANLCEPFKALFARAIAETKAEIMSRKMEGRSRLGSR